MHTGCMARETIVSHSVKVTTVPLHKRDKRKDRASTGQQKTRKRGIAGQLYKRKKKNGSRVSFAQVWYLSVARAIIASLKFTPLIFTSGEYIREKRCSSSITGWTFCWRITWQNSGISVGTGSRADLLSGVALLTSLSLRLTTLRELLVICRTPTISTQIYRNYMPVQRILDHSLTEFPPLSLSISLFKFLFPFFCNTDYWRIEHCDPVCDLKTEHRIIYARLLQID